MIKKSDFYYDLPTELIAQKPLEDRAASRLLVYDRKEDTMEHQFFRDVVDLIEPNDCLVINDSKVIPARIYGVKKDTGAKVEVLLLKRKGLDKWETLVKPGRRVREGTEIIFGDGLLKAKVLEIVDEGNRIIEFSYDGVFEEILNKIGEMPLPHYIKEKLEDNNRYQTVYADKDGSAAAPTAGLHFTEEILKNLENKGVSIAKLTLHVGLGTFRPIKEDDILDHAMHTEYFEINQDCVDKINSCRGMGGRVVAVGTTSLRTLESCDILNEKLIPTKGNTDIFIYPGYKFKVTDRLITNFHLPESSLIVLIAALCGRENTLKVYQEAVAEKYRFFSFGDAMFIK